MKTKYHYFYKITNNINGHFYYGVHNTDNLDDGYMGSGKRLHFAYKKYGIENFTKEIIKFFDTTKEAFEYEAEIVNECLINDNNCYNIKLGGYSFTDGLAVVRDNNGNVFAVSVTDPRLLSGELHGHNIGRVVVKDKEGKRYSVYKNDKRLKTGELTDIHSGKSIYVDNEGDFIYCSIDDDRVKSGELISASKNTICVKDSNNKFYRVSKDDERYLNGILVPCFTGEKHSEETKNKMKNTFKTTKHQQGEKNSQYGTCWIHNNTESIKIKKEDLEKYISLGWVKGRKMFKQN